MTCWRAACGGLVEGSGAAGAAEKRRAKPPPRLGGPPATPKAVLGGALCALYAQGAPNEVRAAAGSQRGGCVAPAKGAALRGAKSRGKTCFHARAKNLSFGGSGRPFFCGSGTRWGARAEKLLDRYRLGAAVGKLEGTGLGCDGAGVRTATPFWQQNQR